MLTLGCGDPSKALYGEFRVDTMSTPARHWRQGLYLANRGFEARQLGQIGLLQQIVMKMVEAASERGGKDEEQAMQRKSPADIVAVTLCSCEDNNPGVTDLYIVVVSS